RAGRDLELVVAFQGRHLQLIAQGGLDEVDVELDVQIVLDALEDLVRRDLDSDVEAAVGAAVGADLAFAGEPDLGAVVDAGRDFDLQGATDALAAGAATVGTGRLNDPALTTTAVAGAGINELPENAALDAPDLAGALAVGAFEGLGARLRAQA